jgi:transcriptional regulatory protein RtcR
MKRSGIQGLRSHISRCFIRAEAGRLLFAVSRSQRGSTNDADRLRKYLKEFGLEWANL